MVLQLLPDKYNTIGVSFLKQEMTLSMKETPGIHCSLTEHCNIMHTRGVGGVPTTIWGLNSSCENVQTHTYMPLFKVLVNVNIMIIMLIISFKYPILLSFTIEP